MNYWGNTKTKHNEHLEPSNQEYSHTRSQHMPWVMRPILFITHVSITHRWNHVPQIKRIQNINQPFQKLKLLTRWVHQRLTWMVQRIITTCHIMIHFLFPACILYMPSMPLKVGEGLPAWSQCVHLGQIYKLTSHHKRSYELTTLAPLRLSSQQLKSIHGQSDGTTPTTKICMWNESHPKIGCTLKCVTSFVSENITTLTDGLEGRPLC